LVYRLSEDGRVPPKHVGVNKRLYCFVCVRCDYVGFINKTKVTFLLEVIQWRYTCFCVYDDGYIPASERVRSQLRIILMRASLTL